MIWRLTEFIKPVEPNHVSRELQAHADGAVGALVPRVRVVRTKRVRYRQVEHGHVVRLGPEYDAVAPQLAEELDAQEPVEAHEEREEKGDVVDLLARALEDLVDAGLGHGELEEGADEADHDHWARGAEHAEEGVVGQHAGDLEHLEQGGDPEEERHDVVELAPAVSEVGVLALERNNGKLNQ